MKKHVDLINHAHTTSGLSLSHVSQGRFSSPWSSIGFCHSQSFIESWRLRILKAILIGVDGLVKC